MGKAWAESTNDFSNRLAGERKYADCYDGIVKIVGRFEKSSLLSAVPQVAKEQPTAMMIMIVVM